LRTDTQQWLADQMQQRHARSEQVKAELNQFIERRHSEAVVEAEPVAPVQVGITNSNGPSPPIIAPTWSEPIVIDGVTMPTAPERRSYATDAAYEQALSNWARDSHRVCDGLDRAAQRNLHVRW
jgi:hypothetical protein